jgi:hypothetical protein
MTPKAYTENLPPIKLFIPYPVETNHRKKGEKKMEKEISPVFVSVQERPNRKMVVRRGRQAECYFSYCEEMGEDIWGILLSIKEAVREPVGMWLPKAFRKPDTSQYVMAVEVPFDYNKALPDGFEFMELPPCCMMTFQGQPFNDDDFGEACDAVIKTIEKYNPEINGYKWAEQDAPREQLEPQGKRGYIESRPVISE